MLNSVINCIITRFRFTCTARWSAHRARSERAIPSEPTLAASRFSGETPRTPFGIITWHTSFIYNASIILSRQPYYFVMYFDLSVAIKRSSNCVWETQKATHEKSIFAKPVTVNMFLNTRNVSLFQKLHNFNPRVTRTAHVDSLSLSLSSLSLSQK